MRTRFAGKADFLTIYIKEAHPEDEWQVTSNEKEAICYPQPTTLAERVAIAGDFVEKVEYEIPLLVDPMDDPADEIYAGWPERLYIVDRAGRVAYKGGMGPFDFEPDEVEDWLEATFPDVPPAPATEDGGTES